MNNIRCVFCKNIIPEGRQVCPNCEDRYSKPHDKIALSREQFTNILWSIIGKEGIIITNQNIDWLIERVYKEVIK